MLYNPYADGEYYHTEYGGTIIPDEELSMKLKQASRHVDSLTYNRIVGRGILNLTKFQQEVIRDVTCRQADFEYENADIIESVLQSYSINGASMQFGASWNVFIQNGVAMQKNTYAQLMQTGLACRMAVR